MRRPRPAPSRASRARRSSATSSKSSRSATSSARSRPLVATSAGEAAEETLRTNLPHLDDAINQDAYCERAYFYRGVLQKRLGNGPAAFKDFGHVVRINPKHVDAQREIRIFEMRARKGSGESALDALIPKVKKK
jgi:hypothetical protein